MRAVISEDTVESDEFDWPILQKPYIVLAYFAFPFSLQNLTLLLDSFLLIFTFHLFWLLFSFVLGFSRGR